MSRKYKLLNISYSLLLDALKLPGDLKIIRSRDDILYDRLQLVVEHPDFPELREGYCLSEVRPQHSVENIQIPKFDGWE